MQATTRTAQGTIDEGRLGWWQFAALALTVLLNALDGFDVMAISFAAPGIAAEWNVSPDVLGWILSMELLGMAAGSILLGNLADRLGRRPTILGCLTVMTIGMWLAPLSSNPVQLSIWRLLTGLGIGGMLAALNATAAELSNRRYRDLILPLMVVGYPVGGFLGGLLASKVLTGGDWRSVFYLGAGLSTTCIPLVVLLLPETPAWLEERRPAGALDRINRILARFRLPAMDGLPPRADVRAKVPVSELLRKPLLPRTVLLTLAYLTHVTAYYFFVKWIPKIVVDMGFDASEGARVLTVAMLGGAVGGILLGVLALKTGMRWATVGALAGSFVMLNVFGRTGGEIAALAQIAGLTAFFSNAAAVGFYALLAMAFPSRVRAAGTGFGIGFGRAGAAMGPALAGMLFAGGMGIAGVAFIISIGSALSIVAVLLVKMPRAGSARSARSATNG